MMRKMPTFLIVMFFLLALALCQCILPTESISQLENRVLTQKPEFFPKAFFSDTYAEDLESFAADQLPLRDQFVSLYAAMQRILGRRTLNDTVLGQDGFLFELSDKWSIRNVRMNAAALQDMASRTGKTAYLLAVPSAAMIYPERLPDKVPAASEDELLAAAQEQTNLLPLLPSLQAADTSSLYYATDHHWTAAGARIGYLTICNALNLLPYATSDIRSYDGFYGSFYARYPIPWLGSDAFVMEAPEGIRLLIDGTEKSGLLDTDAVQGRDKYAALLYGNHGSIELINDAVAEDTLLVIKDSYANALLPLLAQHYHRITAVDPRYFAGNIMDIIEHYEGDAILCVYGVNTLATGRTIALLEGL